MKAKRIALALLVISSTTSCAIAAPHHKATARKAPVKIAVALKSKSTADNTVAKTTVHRSGFSTIGCERDNVESVYFSVNDQGECNIQVIDTSP